MRPRRAAAFAALAAAAALLAVDIVTPTLDIDAGENVVCTFTNTKLQLLARTPPDSYPSSKPKVTQGTDHMHANEPVHEWPVAQSDRRPVHKTGDRTR